MAMFHGMYVTDACYSHGNNIYVLHKIKGNYALITNLCIIDIVKIKWSASDSSSWSQDILSVLWVFLNKYQRCYGVANMQVSYAN